MSSIPVSEETVLAMEARNAQRRKELIKKKESLLSASEPEPNFPPECCCVKPIIYHNIREQVPVTQRRFMYALAGLYVSLLVLIIYNIVVSLIVFILGGSAVQFGLSFLYLLGLPGAWITWYYNVYCGIVYASRPRQVLSLAGMFLGFAFDAWMAVGVPGFGGCGWIFFFSVMGNVVCLVLVLICAILWTLHGIAMFIMAIRYWATSGALLRDPARIYQEAII